MRILSSLIVAGLVVCANLDASEHPPKPGIPAPKPSTTEAPQPAKRPATPRKAATSGEIKAMVERLRVKIAEETAAAPVAAPPPSAKAQQPRRIRLVWRTSLVWPEELRSADVATDVVGATLTGDSRPGGM